MTALSIIANTTHASEAKPVSLISRARAVVESRGGSWSSNGPAPASKRGNRRPSKFKQSDIQRALAAATKSGAKVTVEITPDGTIRLVPTSETMTVQGTPDERRIML